MQYLIFADIDIENAIQVFDASFTSGGRTFSQNVNSLAISSINYDNLISLIKVRGKGNYQKHQFTYS